jgi:hypothetical protein
MELGWIHPLFGFQHDLQHVAVPEGGRRSLEGMTRALTGAPDKLVAIYIPEARTKSTNPKTGGGG